MADNITGNTEVGNTKQEMIADLVQRELKFKAMLPGIITDVSEFAVPGYDSVSFPKFTSFTAQDRSEGQAGDAQALTSSLDKLELDKNAYISWVIDKKTKVQSAVSLELAYARRAAAAHARFVDNKIIAVMRAAATSFENTGADADVTYANLLSMFEDYMSNDGLQEEGHWTMSVAQHNKAMNLTELKSLDTFGEPVIRNGVIQQLFGMPVMIHNGFTSSELFLLGKESIALGFQAAPQIDEQKAIEFGTGAMRTAIDQLFGVKALQTGEKGSAAGKSALIFGLND